MKDSKVKKFRTLIEQINRKNWWHSPPVDKLSYKKRAIFLASSYKECAFYGRPLNEPVRVYISNPLIDTEENIIKRIFGEDSSQMEAYKGLASNTTKYPIKVRFRLDAAMYKAVKKKGYDAIAIVTAEGAKKIKEGKLPSSVELNIFNICNSSIKDINRQGGLYGQPCAY